MRSFAKDYDFGMKGEEDIKEKLETFFQAPVTKTHPTHPADFLCNNKYIEVKTRTNRYKSFPTTLLPLSKITFAQSNPTTFVFVFTDGAYYIHYEKELFDTFEVKPFQRFKRTDYHDKLTDYIHIPIEHLKRL